MRQLRGLGFTDEILTALFMQRAFQTGAGATPQQAFAMIEELARSVKAVAN